MSKKKLTCSACRDPMHDCEPSITMGEITICSSCAIGLIEPIYFLGGCGGIQHMAYKWCLESTHNRKKRRTVRDYKKVLENLLHKYNFQCVSCAATERLTIDHIKPVAKGGTDDFENLQILCKSCNSKKGAKYAQN